MLRKIILVLFLCLTFAGVVFAQDLKVNSQLVHEGDNLNLFFENLVAGKITFSLEASNLKKAEITFDKGRTWLEMQREGDYFVYGYRPLSNEVIFPEMLLTDENQGVQTYRPNLRINYQKEKPDQQLEQFLEKFKSFYEAENKERFLNLFSTRYPNRVQFEQAIQNDFYNYKNMRLFYRIDNRAFDDDLEGAIWDVYWQRKYQDRNGNDLTESSANIAMRFDKESGSWLITGLRNNTIFGSSLLASVDLSISSTDVSFTDGAAWSGDVDIVATVHNNGSASVSNVPVSFYQRNPPGVGAYALIGSRTISSISANSQVDTSAIPFAGTPAFNYDFEVIVDLNNTLGETDETNNTATTTHTLP